MLRQLSIRIPDRLNYLADIVEKSRSILELQDDWDDEGSPGYSEQTWERAVTFLLENAVSLWQEKGFCVTAPAIHNGPEGSIDIYWETDNRKLLINVPADRNKLADFYGYDSLGREVKGMLKLSEPNEWLLLWQMG
ncbi:MAG: hypothetical protein KME17_05690 [Cyanosarcina radialis HA8281-LM2]|jgi:hypothetical protein|nr:hypothetical protein [Cyanosarcina radialis HA8281-LM2]